MIALELIAKLEKLPPDTVVLIWNNDFLGTYRAPAFGQDFLTEEKHPDQWFDVGHEERERDQNAVCL